MRLVILSLSKEGETHIYSDVDMACMRPLDPLVDLVPDNQLIFGLSNSTVFELNNALIIRKGGGKIPLLSGMIKNVVASVQK